MGASLSNQSTTPGRSGSASPSMAGMSPSRSTISTGPTESIARTHATIVVPLPPLAA